MHATPARSSVAFSRHAFRSGARRGLTHCSEKKALLEYADRLARAARVPTIRRRGAGSRELHLSRRAPLLPTASLVGGAVRAQAPAAWSRPMGGTATLLCAARARTHRQVRSPQKYHLAGRPSLLGTPAPRALLRFRIAMQMRNWSSIQNRTEKSNTCTRGYCARYVPAASSRCRFHHRPAAPAPPVLLARLPDSRPRQLHVPALATWDTCHNWPSEGS